MMGLAKTNELLKQYTTDTVNEIAVMYPDFQPA